MSRYPSNAASSSVSRECSFIPSTWEQQAARTAFCTQQIRARTILSVWWSSRTMDVAQQFERVRFGIRTLRKRNKHLLAAAEPLHYIINEERQKFGNQIRIDILFACHLLLRDGTRSQYTRRLVHMHPRQSGAKKCRTRAPVLLCLINH